MGAVSGEAELILSVPGSGPNEVGPVRTGWRAPRQTRGRLGRVGGRFASEQMTDLKTVIVDLED